MHTFVLASTVFFGAWILAHANITPYGEDYQELVSHQPGGNYMVGGGGGSYRVMYETNTVVRKLTFFLDSHGSSSSSSSDWHEEKFLRGLIVEFTNGEKQQCGSTTHKSKSFTFQPGEKLRGDLKQCRNGHGTRAGFFEFWTDADRHFNVGSYHDRDFYTTDVEGRALTGLIARCGSDVDALGPILSRRIISSELHDVEYKGLGVNTLVPTNYVNELNFAVLKNNGPAEVTRELSVSKTEATSVTHTSTKTHHIKTNLKVTTEFSGGIPKIAATKVTVEVGFEYGYAWSNSKTEGTTKTKQILEKNTVKVPPYTTLTVAVYQAQQDIDLPYTGLLSILYEGLSSPLETKVSGTLKGVLVSSTKLVVDEHHEGYIGCYKDRPERAMELRVDDVDSVTACRIQCGEEGYGFAGLQAGHQCFCGDQYNEHGKSKEIECDRDCNGGDSSEGKCGGHWRISVYESRSV